MAGVGGGHTNLVLGLRENVTISYGGPFGDSGFFNIQEPGTSCAW